MKNNTYIAKTFHGLEDVLVKELEELGAHNIEKKRRAVQFSGSEALLYMANLKLRAAINILQPIASFKANDKHSLYKEARKIAWADMLHPTNTFAIEAVVHSDNFSHSNFPALVIKDAIADSVRERFHRRPNVERDSPDYLYTVYISKDDVVISLNTSGEPLFKRGYRKKSDIAPINEVLAAGMVALSGWDANSALIDPMCGSGTILIEAALKALNIAPGKYRKSFGFQSWNNYNPELWEETQRKATAEEKNFAPRIIGNDKSPVAIKIARRNIQNAGLHDHIKVTIGDFEDFSTTETEGTLIFNPPYGERIKPVDIDKLYKNIGDTLKQKFSGFKAWIISSNFHAFKHIGLRHASSESLYNGKLECRFRSYELFSGSIKNQAPSI